MCAVKNGITAIGKPVAIRACVTFRMRRKRLFAIRPQRPALSPTYVDPCSNRFLNGDKKENFGRYYIVWAVQQFWCML